MFWVQPVNALINSFQKWNDRHYTHGNINLRLVTVDTLKKWNFKYPTALKDETFLKLLLLDVFSKKALRASVLETLDGDKIRFARGLYLFPRDR